MRTRRTVDCEADGVSAEGSFMIRQPEYGSRNVNDSFYRFEGRMIEKMNAVLGDVALTRAEEKILIWLCRMGGMYGKLYCGSYRESGSETSR